MPDSNKIKFGLSDVHYALATETQDANTGAWTTTYGEFKAIPGAVNLSLNAEGENSNFYADDIIYVVLGSNQGYSGDAEFALLPDYAEVDLLNRVIDDNGVISESAENSIPPQFALTFKIKGDKSDRRYILYRCALTRPAISGSTKEQSITPATDSITITATPRPDDGLTYARTTENTPKAVYDAWNTTVYVPETGDES